MSGLVGPEGRINYDHNTGMIALTKRIWCWNSPWNTILHKWV